MRRMRPRLVGDVLASCAWYLCRRGYRVVRLAAFSLPPLLLVRDRLASVERVDAPPSAFISDADANLAQTAAAAEPSAFERLTTKRLRLREFFSAEKLGEGACSSWVLTVLAAREVHRGGVVRAAHPCHADTRVYGRVAALPGDLVFFPYAHLKQPLSVRQQQQRASPDLRLLDASQLLALLQKETHRRRSHWQRWREERLRAASSRGDAETAIQHIRNLYLQQEAQERILENHIRFVKARQAQGSADAQYVVFSVPRGRCWLQSLNDKTASPDSEQQPPERETTAPELSARGRWFPLLGAYWRFDASALTPQTAEQTALAAAEEEREMRESLSDEERAKEDSLSFGLVPLALVEGVVAAVAPAPPVETRVPRESNLDRETQRRYPSLWSRLKHFTAEAAALVGAPASLLPVSQPDAFDSQPNETAFVRVLPPPAFA